MGKQAEVKPAESGTAAILHTTYGDIHIRLFPEAAPKAVENFVTHSKNGYYNNTIFHRVIRKFMIQVRCDITPHRTFGLLIGFVSSVEIPLAMALEARVFGARSLKMSFPR